MQKTLAGITQGSTNYISIVTIIIESYGLESIWLFAIIAVSKYGVLVFFAESVIYVQVSSSWTVSINDTS